MEYNTWNDFHTDTKIPPYQMRSKLNGGGKNVKSRHADGKIEGYIDQTGVWPMV